MESTVLMETKTYDSFNKNENDKLSRTKIKQS